MVSAAPEHSESSRDEAPDDASVMAPEDALVDEIGRIARWTAIGKDHAGAAMEWAERMRARSSLIDTGFRIYERDVASAGSVLGSAIALKMFLFFVPLLVFIVGLSGFFGGFVDEDTLSEAAGLTGQMAEQISYAFNQPNSTRWTAVLAGLFGSLYAGRSLARALLVSSSVACQTGGRVSGKLRVIASVVGVIVGIAFVAVLLNRLRWETRLLLLPISMAGAFVIFLVMFATLMVTLPRQTTDPGAVLPGALVTALALVGMLVVSQFYLPNKFENASSLYGGIGVAIVSLGWFFILGRSLSLAFAVNAVLYERYGSITQVVFRLPVLRVVPRRWEWFRRYFGLDESMGSDSTAGADDALAVGRPGAIGSMVDPGAEVRDD
jgi:membrane protein